MAPGFQSSFIPKDPVATPEVFKKKKAGIFGVLAVSFFMTTVIISGALYAYKSIIKNDIESLKIELTEAGRSIDRKTIGEMSAFSKKLDVVKSIVLKHKVVSGFLASLASSTVSTVSFNEFTYSNLSEEGLTVTMKGKTNSYSSIALQESIFTKNKYWQSVAFSGLTLGTKGTVSFNVAVTVDPEIATYAPELSLLPETAEDSEPAEDLDTGDLNLNIDDLNI